MKPKDGRIDRPNRSCKNKNSTTMKPWIHQNISNRSKRAAAIKSELLNRNIISNETERRNEEAIMTIQLRSETGKVKKNTVSKDEISSGEQNLNGKKKEVEIVPIKKVSAKQKNLAKKKILRETRTKEEKTSRKTRKRKIETTDLISSFTIRKNELIGRETNLSPVVQMKNISKKIRKNGTDTSAVITSDVTDAKNGDDIELLEDIVDDKVNEKHRRSDFIDDDLAIPGPSHRGQEITNHSRNGVEESLHISQAQEVKAPKNTWGCTIF